MIADAFFKAQENRGIEIPAGKPPHPKKTQFAHWTEGPVQGDKTDSLRMKKA